MYSKKGKMDYFIDNPANIKRNGTFFEPHN